MLDQEIGIVSVEEEPIKVSNQKDILSMLDSLESLEFEDIESSLGGKYQMFFNEIAFVDGYAPDKKSLKSGKEDWHWISPQLLNRNLKGFDNKEFVNEYRANILDHIILEEYRSKFNKKGFFTVIEEREGIKSFIFIFLYK